MPDLATLVNETSWYSSSRGNSPRESRAPPELGLPWVSVSPRSLEGFSQQQLLKKENYELRPEAQH